MKFDAVVGNPPYQIMDGGHGSSSQPIYNVFVEMSQLLKPSYLSMIMPSRWMTGGKGLDAFRYKMINDKHLRVLHDYLSAQACFSSVQIEGGICYFLWDKNNEGKCKLYSHLTNGTVSYSEMYLNELNTDVLIRDQGIISILKKVHNGNIKTFDSLVFPRNAFGIFDIPSTAYATNSIEAKYAILGRFDNKRAIRYLNNSFNIFKNLDLAETWKVFISKADGAAGQIGNPIPARIIGKAEIGYPNMICTETFLAIGPLDNEIIAKNVCTYMKSKFFRIIVGIRKNKNMTRDTYAFVPLQDFTEHSDIDWSKSVEEIDQQLYKKYNLTDEEITFIESMIKPME